MVKGYSFNKSQKREDPERILNQLFEIQIHPHNSDRKVRQKQLLFGLLLDYERIDSFLAATWNKARIAPLFHESEHRDHRILNSREKQRDDRDPKFRNHALDVLLHRARVLRDHDRAKNERPVGKT